MSKPSPFDPNAERCLTLLEALAQVGKRALADEVTGAQAHRPPDALQQLLTQYAGDWPWMRTFPEEFTQEAARLHRGAPYDVMAAFAQQALAALLPACNGNASSACLLALHLMRASASLADFWQLVHAVLLRRSKASNAYHSGA